MIRKMVNSKRFIYFLVFINKLQVFVYHTCAEVGVKNNLLNIQVKLYYYKSIQNYIVFNFTFEESVVVSITVPTVWVCNNKYL